MTATVTLPYGAVKSFFSQAEADANALVLATQLANAKAAANQCDQPTSGGGAITGAGGDVVTGAGGEPLEPVSF